MYKVFNHFLRNYNRKLKQLPGNIWLFSICCFISFSFSNSDLMFFAKLQMIWLVITNVKGKFHSKFKHTTVFVSLQKLWRCFISFLSASILLFAGFSENKFKRGTSSLQWEFNNFGLRIFSRHFRKITIYFFSCYLLVSLFGGGEHSTVIKQVYSNSLSFDKYIKWLMCMCVKL